MLLPPAEPAPQRAICLTRAFLGCGARWRGGAGGRKEGAMGLTSASQGVRSKHDPSHTAGGDRLAEVGLSQRVPRPHRVTLTPGAGPGSIQVFPRLVPGE